jgi:hypothetical protein
MAQFRASAGLAEHDASVEEIQSMQKELESGALSDAEKRSTLELIGVLQAEGAETYEERMIR